MVSRILTFCVVCLLACAPIQAEPTVFFRGKQLTFRHFVYGEVTAASGRVGTINMGYAHGLYEAQAVGVLRRSHGNLLPVGVLRLTKVRPGDAFGEFEGEFSIRRDDIVIVSARELNVWRGRPRSSQLVIDTLLNRSPRGYDTGDVSPALLDEVGRDDGLIANKQASFRVNSDLHATQRPKTTVAIVRGAFRPASGDEDGAANSLSAKDRELSPDQPTLALESGLARFATSSATGRVAIDDQSARLLGQDLAGIVDLSEVRTKLNRANTRVHTVLQPR